MVIVEENRDRSEVIGNAEMPYLNSLASKYENTTNWNGVGHPSLPNYLALISGSTQGVTSDGSEPFPGVATLGSQLTAAGIPWKAYMEDMPEAAYTGVQAGLYVKKHNPFAFFPGTNGPNVVPGSQYAADLAAGTLPAFVWYSPNLVNDGHELSNAAVDANLKSLLTPLLQSQWYSQGGTIIVTYDEDEGEHKVPTVVIHGTGTSSTDTAPGNHCGTLAAIEHIYGLGLLGCASGATPLELPVTGTTEAGGLLVGINGIADRGAAQAKVVIATCHCNRDRIDVGTGADLSAVSEAVAEGVSPLVLYNPGANELPSLSIPTIEAQIAALAAKMKPLGLDSIEFGNEVYYHGAQPAAYAAQYAAAHKVLAGSGIKLLANLYGDWNGSTVLSGGGWGAEFAAALGFAPDGWTLHPYGPETGPANLGENEGWGIVPTLIEWLHKDGIYAPLHVTEVGQPVWTGTDGRASVSEAEQATDVAKDVADCAKWGCAELDWFEMADSSEPGGGSEGGYGLWNDKLQARPSAKALGEAVAGL